MKISALSLAAVATFASTASAAKPQALETIQCGQVLEPGKVTELQESLICENDKEQPALIMSEGSILKVKEGAKITLYGRSGASTTPLLNKPLEEFKEADVIETPAILIPKDVTMAKVEGLEIKGFEHGILVEGATDLEIKDVKMEQLKKTGLLMKNPMDERELVIEPLKKTVTIIDTKMEAIGVTAIDIEKVHVELNLIRTQISDVGFLAASLEEKPAALKLSLLQPKEAETTHLLEDVKISAIKGTGVLVDLPKYDVPADALIKYPEVKLRVQGKTKIDFVEGKALEFGKATLPAEDKTEMSERVELAVAPWGELKVKASAQGFKVEKAKFKLEAGAECEMCQNGPITEPTLDEPIRYDLEIPAYATPSQFSIDATAKWYFDDVDGFFRQEREIKENLHDCTPKLETTILIKEQAPEDREQGR